MSQFELVRMLMPVVNMRHMTIFIVITSWERWLFSVTSLLHAEHGSPDRLVSLFSCGSGTPMVTCLKA